MGQKQKSNYSVIYLQELFGQELQQTMSEESQFGVQRNTGQNEVEMNRENIQAIQGVPMYWIFGVSLYSRRLWET